MNMTPIKRAFERNVRALTLRPSVGQGTAVTTVHVRDGGTCDIEDGPWKLVADLDHNQGGNGAGADPGVLGRAALGSCLAIGYVLRAAHRALPLTRLEVEVQTDYDARGPYGVAELPPGWSAVRYIVTVESPAPEADVLALLDEADAHSSLLDDFSRALDIRREVRISAPVGVGGL